jgi:hypothetical protein
MLPRCNSSWLRMRLPTCGPAVQIPASSARRAAFICKAQLRNSTRQLSISAPPWSHHNTLPSIATRRPSFPCLAAAMASHSHARSHSGHSGHHHHVHDNTYLVSSNKADAGVRITRIGLFVNLAMAIGKGIGGYVFHSQCKLCTAYFWEFE